MLKEYFGVIPSSYDISYIIEKILNEKFPNYRVRKSWLEYI
jgi:hypothetical protein